MKPESIKAVADAIANASWTQEGSTVRLHWNQDEAAQAAIRAVLQTEEVRGLVVAAKQALRNLDLQVSGGFPSPDIQDHLHLVCERHGYGAVIATAAYLWRKKDPRGSFLYGPCALIGEENQAQLRQALAALEAGHE